MSEPYFYTDPDGDHLEIRPAHGGSVVIAAHDTSDNERTCISLLVGEFEEFVTALYEAAGLPVPELVVPAGVDNAGQSRTTSDDDWKPYTDPREAAQAAAWAGEFDG